MPSAAATAARTARAGLTDKTVPAYAAPTAPANITHAPITDAEEVALSPTHPLGTVKEEEDEQGE